MGNVFSVKNEQNWKKWSDTQMSNLPLTNQKASSNVKQSK